jgi:hypothetical protein
MSRGFHENVTGPSGSVYMSQHLGETMNALSLDSARSPFHIDHVLFVHQKTSIVLVTGS